MTLLEGQQAKFTVLFQGLLQSSDFSQCVIGFYPVLQIILCKWPLFLAPYAYSIWAIKLHWLDNVLSFKVTDRDNSFSGILFTFCALSFGKLVVNQLNSCWQKISKRIIILLNSNIAPRWLMHFFCSISTILIQCLKCKVYVFFGAKPGKVSVTINFTSVFKPHAH